VTIQDLGSIGELIAAVATIATLAYLAVQLKQNTASVRASGAVAHSDAMRSLNLVIAQDPELVTLYWDGLAHRADLTQADRRRFDFLIGGQIQSFEQMWRFHEDGVIDELTWAGLRSAISWLAHEPGFIGYFELYGSMLHPGFAEALRKAMAEELHPEAAKAAQQSGYLEVPRDANPS